MSVAQILHIEASAFLYGLAAVVVYQMLTGSINTSGLLSEKRATKSGSPPTSPERVQLLLATIAAASNYLAQAARTGAMPDISNRWLYLLGGSSGLYAVSKLVRTYHHNKKLQEGR